jgi:L-lysine 2,3-aminomutase
MEEDEIKKQLIEEMGYSDEEDLDEDEIEELEKLVKDYKPRVVFNISGECTDYE